ncbi:MAG: FecCD family ABC transporter permease [Janthinobacterium lividum]
MSTSSSRPPPGDAAVHRATVRPHASPARRAPQALPAALLLLVLCALAGLCAGRYPVSPADVARTLGAALRPAAGSAHAAHAALLRAIVVDARLPRLTAAALVGAALSVAGASYQAVFRNPLVSPGLLGVLSGSAFGAALGIVVGAQGAWIQLFAFGAGVLSVLVGLAVGGMIRGGGVLMLVLGGLISNALFTSLLSLVKYVADPLNQLPAIVYWMLGSLAQTGWPDLARLAPPLLVGILLLCGCARVLDTLTLSDDEALSLGVPVTAIRFGVIAVATLVSALTVSLAGMIGWVGLLVPHIARAIVGASNTRLLPLSALLGAAGLILADTAARSLAPGEIPLGIITELFGALAFVVVLRRLRHTGP